MTANIRDTLLHEIESARENYQYFLVIIPEKALHYSSKDVQWTNAEILYKISISPLAIHSVLTRNIGRWTQRMLPIPGTGSLFPKWEEKSVLTHASRMSLMNFTQEYHNNCNQVLEILDELQEEDLEKTVTGLEIDRHLTGRIKVEELFHYVKNYYDKYRHLVDLDS